MRRGIPKAASGSCGTILLTASSHPVRVSLLHAIGHKRFGITYTMVYLDVAEDVIRQGTTVSQTRQARHVRNHIRT